MRSELETTGALDRRGRTRALIVRHGQSTFNVQQRYQGRSDEPVLTESGIAAAVKTGRHLATERVDALISSPLRRAQQTAEIIGAVLRERSQGQLLLHTNNDLMEIHLPEWEGLAFEAVRQHFPASYQTWSNQPQNFRMPARGRSTSFPVRDLFEQANRFWWEFLPHHAGQTAVLVTHGGTARALISTAVGLGPERFHSFQQSNCGISILEFPATSTTGLVEALNLTAHLGERLPKLKLGRGGTRMVMVAGDTPMQSADHVSAILNALPVDFVLSADDPQSKKVARALSASYPSAHLGIFPGTVLFNKQRPEALPLADRIAWPQHSLSTGVLVGQSSELGAMLSTVLRIDGRSSPWKHSTNAVLHYPATGTTPVIQTLNMPVWQNTLDPVSAEAWS
jgi:probable phosphoglycerate mutase